MNDSKIWLIGSGQMAIEYFKVLKKLNINFRVLGRGILTAKKFKKITNCEVELGGIKANIKKFGTPKYAIVTVDADQLKNVAKDLISAGTRNILLEKPGALNIEELKKLIKISKRKQNKILIAYNRRFYSSIIKAKKIINKDGGLKSIFFDFTEYSKKIKNLRISKIVKNKWVISNSSHVIDLAFYLGGKPKFWNYYHDGKIDWHPSSSRFCGAGISNKEVIFSYLSDWQSPGRWGIELFTYKRKLILRPMEKLQETKKEFSHIKNINFSNNLDIEFKPGLFLQTNAFLNEDFTELCTIQDQLENFKFYYKIAGYK